MNVKQLIRALEKVKNPRLPVRVIDKPAKFEAEIASVELSGASEMLAGGKGDADAAVLIVIEEWPSL